MKKEAKIKNVVIYSISLLVVIIAFDLFLKPEVFVNLNVFSKLSKKMVISQNISPQRLFVNTWRIVRNSYVDKNLNGQDWKKWRYRYKGKIKTIDDANVAINSMLASLNDPYTKFLPADTFSKQKVILNSKIKGIGILFEKSGNNVVINHVLDNSPAQAANLLPGDKIVGINGQNKSSEIINVMGNDKTDKVQLTIKRKDQLITKELSKKDLHIKTMEYKITPENIAIITLLNIMGEKAVENFRKILVDTNDASALIIDLRNNYGGILANSIQMANYMLDVDMIVGIESRLNGKYQIYSANEKIFKDKPIIILINHNTASAAEILVGALKDNLDAVVIGENSFGKNSIQQVISLHNSSGLLITTDKYILPSGEDIYKKGLTPDIYIKQDSIILPKNDIQLKKAIEILTELMKKEKESVIM